MRRGGKISLLALGLAAWLAPAAAPLAGQGLASRVRGQEGDVAFRFPTRAGVEICENGFRTDDGRTRLGRVRRGWRDTCMEGPAEVVLEVRGGQVRDVGVAPPGFHSSDVDLGDVAAAEAAGFLLSLAGTADREVAKDAMAPASVADAETWPRFLEIARDRSADGEVRRSALFWVSREAAQVVTRGLSEVARDERDDEEVRKAAVFALSRRPPEEAVPTLMDVARTAPGREVRESALFWLARIDDPRVIPFFEDILLGREPGD